MGYQDIHNHWYYLDIIDIIDIILIYNHWYTVPFIDIYQSFPFFKQIRNIHFWCGFPPADDATVRAGNGTASTQPLLWCLSGQGRCRSRKTYENWLVVWLPSILSSLYWESHHPSWLSYFAEGRLNHQPVYQTHWGCSQKKVGVI